MFGHDQHHAVATHRGSHRERNAGIARRRLDQRIAGFDLSALFSFDDHGQRRAILHRSRRIVALQLGEENVTRRSRQPLKLDERSVAYGIFDRLVHVALRRLLLFTNAIRLYPTPQHRRSARRTYR